MAAVTWLAGCLLLAVSVAGFSLDVDRAAVYSGDSGSLFGFSVAAHRDQQTGWGVNRINSRNKVVLYTCDSVPKW